MKLWSKKLDNLNRTLHRDLGYLFIGLTLIYGLSGIAVILRHIDIDLIHSETKIEKQFTPNLSKEEFTKCWKEQKELPKLTRVRPAEGESYQVMAKGGRGLYNKTTGEVELTFVKTNKFFKFVNDIHYNVGKRFTWLALLYSFMLIFFAISGAIIVKGKKGFMKRGIWFTLVGIAIPLIAYFLM